MYGNRNGKFSQTNILSYIMFTIFWIAEIYVHIGSRSQVSFVCCSSCDGMSLSSAENTSDLIFADIFFIIITLIFICMIPVISTIIQFFCNRKFFEIQFVIVCSTILISNLPYLINILTIIKNLIFKV